MKKNVLITGTSAGFGLEATRQLLQRGHTVIAAVRGGATRMQNLLGQEWTAAGERALGVELHLDDPQKLAKNLSDLQAVIRTRLGGRLDVLINNAGFGVFGPLEDLSFERIRHQMEVNFFGPVKLTQELLPALRSSRGKLIQISSVAGRVGFPFYGAYNASKFALEGVSEALALELIPHGVQVCLVEPGGFRTSFTADQKRAASWEHRPDSAYGALPWSMEKATLDFQARLGNPARVGRLLTRLVERKRIPFRIPIGADSVALLTISRILPHRLRLWLVHLGYVVGVYSRGKPRDWPDSAMSTSPKQRTAR